MAVQSNFKNMSLCLFVICLVCSALLAVVYAFTKSPVEAAEANKTSAAIAQVVPEFDGDPAPGVAEVDGKNYNYYTLTNGGETSGYAVEAVSSGFGGPLKLMVGFTPEGVIYNVAVLDNSQETPGLGAKCSDESFRGQFRNFDPSVKKLTVSKDGGDVDAITAATITSRGFCKALEVAVAVYNTVTSGAGECCTSDEECGAEAEETNEGGSDNE
ncbi:MAG: RnfABCDGE type electron transport complex subunit G [Bacteroidales bacterium]|nr:RnfABCDGE type electron transport complex subunit G [Bacteroidales bacterium]